MCVEILKEAGSQLDVVGRSQRVEADWNRPPP